MNKGALNIRGTIHYLVARASTTAEWREVNNFAAARLEEKMAEVHNQGHLTDEQAAEFAVLNTYAVMAHEIISMRTAAEAVLDPSKR